MAAGRTSATERDVAHPRGDCNELAGLADLLVQVSSYWRSLDKRMPPAARPAGPVPFFAKPSPPNGLNSMRCCTG